MRAPLLFVLISLVSLAASAEYRVFQLLITDVESGRARTVVSTLDNLQYKTYRQVRKTETIAIQDSWMCWKRSDHFNDLCPNPRGPASAAPPSASSPKTAGAAQPAK